MSVSRPARCLLSVPSIPRLHPRLGPRTFHTTPNLAERRRPRYTSIKASDPALIEAQRKAKVEQARETFKAYTAEEKEFLAKQYTPEQLAAIEAGEKAIDPVDLDARGVIRSDWGSLTYVDDFATRRPFVDKKANVFEGPVDPNARLMTLKEMSLADAEYEWDIIQQNPQEKDFPFDDPVRRAEARPSRTDLLKSFDEVPITVGSQGPISPKHQSIVAPMLPIGIEAAVDGTGKQAGDEEADVRDPDGVYDLLRRQTGLTLDQIFEYRVKILVQHRVVNQTRLGKIQSLYCLAICGNGEGRLGIGEAKGQETEDAMKNARIQAIKNMKPIPRYENRTIYGEVEGKVSAVEVKLMSRPPGFGLRCQHLIFEMARAAGIQDLAARVPRSRNKMNTVKATYQALMKQRIPDEIARGLGKKLVDVRKVYYGGRV
ncbi:hypothetical protein HYFRA_00003898 [Hymenoscyphus fraxineus]|uniref:Small ribosomal subunit protein uS5m n=1 Tax=Hymenoscyphus fraxineus TaxID=746836 RepID=A0A9N9PR51_9HELO|nr:hypothetical protein HYFRA_00003898 [Hymenoscyphus fraxineus]